MSCETETYIIGETLRVAGTVTLDGAPTDPTSLTATAVDPEGATYAASTSQDGGDGEFAAWYTPSGSGPTGSWKLRTQAVVGGDTEIEDTSFIVVA